MYRLYVDEVGTDTMSRLDEDNHRYLSLTGVAMKITDARDVLEPALNVLKSTIFDHDPDSPVVLHRKEIMGGKGPYQILRQDASVASAFDTAILDIFTNTPYFVITALIDKAWMADQWHWQQTHPYHYLLEILVEKYVRFLERMGTIGDIMPESRQGKDGVLQAEYNKIRANGTTYRNPAAIEAALRGPALKFRTKKDNVAGLQLCDLLAHPSHIFVRDAMGHPVNLGPFARKVCDVLKKTKYDRSPWDGRLKGYGYKHLPG